jgi:murein DD-endopeptidase MepM/ murein hydrolase activator NlpD
MNDDANRTRRQLFSSVLGVAGAFAVARVASDMVVGRGGRLSASGQITVDEPAAVDSPAVRLGEPPTALVEPPEGKVAFPIDPDPECFVLDNYGDCRGSRMHIGIDILASKGQAVYAVADGLLTQVYLNTGAAGYGWTLQAADGSRYRYFHLDTFGPGLKIGSRVSFGQVLGTVGSTGTGTTDNNHLHFEVYRNGAAVDPLPLLVLPDGVRLGPPLKGCL